MALEDVALVLDGRTPAEVGIDPEHPDAAPEAERLRRARGVLYALRDRLG